jgi:hypothetical protein
MPRVIVGLDYYGTHFYNDVVQYCYRTGQPQSQESFSRIYKECISQVTARLSVDFETFLVNLMELPYWKLINYTPKEECVVFDEVFKNAVRAFGICLWNSMYTNKVLYPNSHFHLESCSQILVIIVIHTDADYV